jgi:hypothetical protein
MLKIEDELNVLLTEKLGKFVHFKLLCLFHWQQLRSDGIAESGELMFA